MTGRATSNRVRRFAHWLSCLRKRYGMHHTHETGEIMPDGRARVRMIDHEAASQLGWPLWRIRLDRRLGYNGHDHTVITAAVLRVKAGRE